MELQQFRLEGTSEEMGRQYGEKCGDMIHAFVSDRIDAVRSYFSDAGRGSIDSFLEAGAKCMDEVCGFDPEGHTEHLHTAAGAEIDPVVLFATANMTDVRDIVTIPGDPIVIEDEGCTAALLPGDMTQSGFSLQGQTWDLNGPDMKHVIAVHRLPAAGPETWTVTCAGCQTLMGMNEHGVTVGTTNLKTHGADVGIPYLSLLHLALRQENLQLASDTVERAKVAGGHTYWVGDRNKAIEWERSPLLARQRTTESGPLARSNHCLFAENTALETDLSESTHARYDRMIALLEASSDHTLESLRACFSNRDDGRLSINRFAEDNSGATTNAVVACSPADLKFYACKGRADIGAWTQLEFERR